MCGILGVRRSWNGDREAAEAALHALRWRGPDGYKLISAGDWYLGVARLAISDPAADQPIMDASGRLVALNGALTSAQLERTSLAAALRTGNDAELLLARLVERGPRSLLDMSGPYAFAILDPATDELFLGRDPEGEKPLYVLVLEDRIVAFASSLASLRALGYEREVPANERAHLFRYGYCQPSRSSGGGLNLMADWHGLIHQGAERGWRQLSGCDAPRLPGGSLARRLDAAVARCAQAEVPVGLCLSGGIDSSCIAVGLQRAGRSLPAYQFRAIGEPPDERQIAVRVAAHCGQDLRPVDGGPEILQSLPFLTACAGMPLGDPSVLAVHALGRAAASDRVKVLLSGEGADDLLLGYRRHRAAAWLPSVGWRWLPSPRRGMGGFARMLRALASSRPYDSLLAVVPPAFEEALWPNGIPGGEVAPRARSMHHRSVLERARDLDRHGYLRGDLLPKLDVALMAAGIEGRCPFLDPAMLDSEEVKACSARELLGKRPLRLAYGGALPKAVMRQRKRGLALPVDRWLREDSYLCDLLSDKRCRQRAEWSGQGLSRLLDQHRRRRLNIGRGLYLVAAYELYLRAVEAAA